MSSAAVAATAAVVDDLVNATMQDDPVAVSEEPVVAAPAASINDDDGGEGELGEMPADLKALLEDDDDDPVSFEPPDLDDDIDEETGYEDPDELRRRLAKTEKKLKHYEDQRIRSERKNWEKEIARYWPLADAKKIAAESSSRKEAAKRAAAEQAYVEPKVSAAQSKWEKWAKDEIARQVAEREQQLEQAWGRPIGGPGTVPVAQAVEADVQARIQNARTLQERTTLKLRHGVVDI